MVENPPLCFFDDLLLFMSVFSWSVAFLERSSCAEMPSIFFICPFYSALILFPGFYHQFSLMPCSHSMMKDDNKTEFKTVISLSSNR